MSQKAWEVAAAEEEGGGRETTRVFSVAKYAATQRRRRTKVHAADNGHQVCVCMFQLQVYEKNTRATGIGESVIGVGWGRDARARSVIEMGS